LSEPQQRDDDDISIAVEVRSGRSEQRRHDEDGKSITEELRAALPVRRRDEDGESIASELRAALPVRRRVWLLYYGDEAGNTYRSSLSWFQLLFRNKNNYTWPYL
jgi:hypothetical protein